MGEGETAFNMEKQVAYKGSNRINNVTGTKEHKGSSLQLKTFPEKYKVFLEPHSTVEN